MIFRQILHPATGCASYIFGCLGKRSLAVVDPHAEHVQDYLDVADGAQVPIVAIFETHVQADHLSGACALAERTGAPIYLHEAADVTFAHRILHDGDEIPLGNDYARVLFTPGHSSDSLCLIVGDRTRSDAPWFVLTGDTLFVGDAGRPDLSAAELGDEAAIERGAHDAALQLHASLQRLLELPDHLELYPAHFSGSACGRSMSAKPSSTIGFERRFNPALQFAAPEDFAGFMLRDLPPAPERFRQIREANRHSGLDLAGEARSSAS